ncbi:MAG TPA: S1 family peptidase [Oligoflexus sp.]|uniref:S1 family peptidase n=1 Tax=Oligoflexus sp. TaxID=1971216 RepID=UPI002D29C3A5|nr:S1 family peptidase [Oligoflexus sp.]HYX35083.1 S1 family peptidase [Oligoflexus sp.]
MLRLPCSLAYSFVLMSLLTLLSGCGTSNVGTSKLGIVGGRPVSAGEKGPAVGLLLRYPDPVGGVYLTKTCTGVRVSSTQVLTAASCLSGSGNNPVQLTLLVTGDGTRAPAPIITNINIHPNYEANDGETSPYNVALIRLASFPTLIDGKVSVAALSDHHPAVGSNLKVFGAGCEKLQTNEKCDGGYTILRYLKTFDTILDKFEADTFGKQFFTTVQESGLSVDGDQGGPVLNSQGALVGLASYRKSNDSSDADGKYSVYLNLVEPEIKDFLSSSISNQLPIQQTNFSFQLVEGVDGSFMPVGSNPTVELSSSFTEFDFSFTLNGVAIEASDIITNGTRFTLKQALLEGVNALSLVAVDADNTPIFEEEIQVYAGSRTIRLAAPEVINSAELDMRADLILNPEIAARGRGWFEGNELVFKNVPKMAAVARIDFPGLGLSYTEFFTAMATGATLQGGRLANLSTNENLDWSKGLAGWTIVNGSQAFRVVKGKDLKDGGTGAVSIAGGSTSPGPVAAIRRNEMFNTTRTSSVNAARYLTDTPFVLHDEKNYVVISPDVGQTAELVKTFQPTKGRRTLELSFALRVRGFDAGSIYNPRALGEYVVQVRNAQGAVTEYLGNLDSSSISPASNGLFFDQIEHIVSNSAEPVEVTIKMTSFDQTYGVPELIVGEVREDEVAVDTFSLDDGVDKTVYTKIVKIKDKTDPKKVTEAIIERSLRPAPLENISLGPCADKCVFDPKLKGFHSLWGNLGISSAKGANIEDIKLVIYDGVKELGIGEIYDPSVKNALVRTVAPNETATVTTRAPLFRFPQTIVPRSDAKGYKVQLLVRIKTGTTVKTKAYAIKINPLTWYPDKNIAGTDDLDRSFGGDKWARADTFKHVEQFTTMMVTDAANIHGGYFYPHGSHTDGKSFDLSHGYNTDKTVNDVLKLLDDKSFADSVSLIYFYLKKAHVTDSDRKDPKKVNLVKRADAIDSVIKRVQELTDVKASDGRYISPFIKKDGQYVLDPVRGKSSIFRHYPGHDNHIHVLFR